MKIIYNIVLIVSVFASSLLQVHAGEQHTEKTLQVALVKTANQTTDSTQVVEMHEKLVTALYKKQQAFEMRVYVLVGIALLLVFIFGVLCFLNKRGDKRLEKIITLLEKRKLPTDEKTNTEHFQLDIDETIIDAILENLQAFENERGFLVSKITLHSFAKQLQTNTKYLSKVINAHKLKSFRNYINDLRVQYSIQKLENNGSYRKYTLKAMAKEAGFATAESFTKAFQKKTGKTVSSFLMHKNQILSE
ncbi:helix-turn-helix domain-containing protein [Kordia sp. YSTF-M3]|uniref:Helix-turn-helix domain-containing protein n=1 Tax=Kordia aestuariivivens TaxID=2759037 RepID=A0ABR7Q608_9FLAO|nr:helix-turn-helix domain-containing protein [Kordia aestuariivivens]MBC8753952.1 helix-turn-helix domain-containing protein [Kordia aestuariivivens]